MSDQDRVKWNQRYTEGAYRGRDHASAFLQTWFSENLPESKTDQPFRCLDVACGAGRNSIYLAKQGFQVTGIDISAVGLARAQASAHSQGVSVKWVEQDLQQPLTIAPPFELILLVRYVDLKLISILLEMLAPNGVLLCEEHMQSTESVAGPKSQKFRVAPGALTTTVECSGVPLRTELSEELVTQDPDGVPVALSRLIVRRVAAGP